MLAVPLGAGCWFLGAPDLTGESGVHALFPIFCASRFRTPNPKPRTLRHNQRPLATFAGFPVEQVAEPNCEPYLGLLVPLDNTDSFLGV